MKQPRVASHLSRESTARFQISRKVCYNQVIFTIIAFGEHSVMTLTVEATYENGVLRPHQPLPLKENEKVQVTIEVKTSPIMQAAGIMGWTGDAESLERIALDPEFLPEESP